MLHITDKELLDKFRYLQSDLRDRWKCVEGDESDTSDVDILVIPSISLDQRELKKVEGYEHYEERLLFALIRLWNPCNRLIYVTSVPLHPSIIDYYLQLLPGIPFSHARNRLLLLSTYDSSLKPLSQKVLERPRLLQHIRQALRIDKSFMICYNSTGFEAQLSLKLGVPLYAAAPDLQIWGTKSGSRQIFAEACVPHPDGSCLMWNVLDLAEAAAQLWERQPSLQRMVVKLNEGISGEGNALLDLRDLQVINCPTVSQNFRAKPRRVVVSLDRATPTVGQFIFWIFLRPIDEFAPPEASHQERVIAITESFHKMSFQAKQETWSTFSGRIAELGAIVEAFVEGEIKLSPSVQGRITPMGEVEILSTHDQILGGPDGQIFLGCKFPADEDYRLLLQQLGLEIGRKLAEKGALERYGVDFIVVKQDDGTWDIQAIEINLRKGGTTHPFMTLKLLTNGRYEPSTGLFYSQQGRPKYYIATDNLQKDRYRGLLPNDLMDIIALHRLHFDTGTETGTVFHLMGCLSEFGKLGLTSIGDSPQQAEEIYNPHSAP